MNDLTVVPTGVANLASVRAAFARLGCALVAARQPQDVADAAAVLLPGVGHFGEARAALDARGLAAPLRQRLRDGRATLGICLGMQLCCEGSDEAPQTPGLGAVPGRVTRFPSAVRCPQMGWNDVACAGDTTLLEPGHAYFANSFRLCEPPAGWAVATAEHGGTYVAALERGAVLLCQFHPELSAGYGEALLRRWLQRAAAEVAC
ncbi:MAG: imidazole glycerol phosphate synthase subunit HisH [Planctomycetes bacterium]|nr:imidazole glycerol phosphate synthase subunit HisH [Planctomycetota bacterium]